MITAGDFRKGVTIEWEGGVWTIVDFQLLSRARARLSFAPSSRT